MESGFCVVGYFDIKKRLPHFFLNATAPCLALEPVISEKGNIFDGVRLYGQMPAMLNGEEDSYFFSEEGKSGVLMRISSEEAGNCVP